MLRKGDFMSRRLAAAAPEPERACELRFHGAEALAEPLLDPCDVRGEPRLHRRHRILRTTMKRTNGDNFNVNCQCQCVNAAAPGTVGEPERASA